MLATVEMLLGKVTDMADTLLGDRRLIQERNRGDPCNGDASLTEKGERSTYPFLTYFSQQERSRCPRAERWVDMPRVSSPLDRRVTARFGGVRIRMRRRVMVGIAMLLGGPIITTSLAATLTINGTGNNAVEFGQGSQVAIGCDTSINTAITEVWDSATTRFKVESIVLTNLDTRQIDTSTIVNNQGCGGKALKISLIDTATNVMTIGTVATSPVTLVLPDTSVVRIGDSTTALAVETATATWPGLIGNWATSSNFTSASTNLIGGKGYIKTGSAGTLIYFLPSSISIDPGRVLRVALETL
jgi:hypothetical protein